ncbi:hypothetical protein F7P78_10990 [Fusobacterium naviforme]|uniref:Uncharacterized protein n=1 Tax=Moryella indoligenes TaxID=371674 RepID=A0AAE3VBV8_9FIRM|nr:hypothetical protein [Moryella indoligenes]KAB0575636.1 hypothetical protein F7P78_10990 [Fusobacterium naviforme]MDQ0153464.1 hypothetical protein [Moryella indoligenes]
MDDMVNYRDQALQQSLAKMEFYPVLADEDMSVAQYTKIPLERLPALGTAFEPIATAVQGALGGTTTQLCKVTIPSGTHLAALKNGAGNIGTVLNNTTNQISGQAVLNPLVCNPTMIFMAAALANIDKKLDSIQELQQEMMDFLVQKEKSELRGNLNFLGDILNHYKYNWNNDMYKRSSHVKVLDIRQTAEQKILFYREQITGRVKKKALLHADKDVKKQMAQLLDLFKEYRLALYTNAFACFLEIMLLGNYDSEYLDSIAGKIREYAFQYKTLYTDVYDRMESYAGSSVQSTLLKGLKTVSKATGEAIAKTPVISKGKVDEALIDAGRRLGKIDTKRTFDSLKVLIDAKDDCVRPFVENIDSVNRLYNSPLEMLFDRENIYLGTA